VTDAVFTITYDKGFMFILSDDEMESRSNEGGGTQDGTWPGNDDVIFW